MHEAVAASWPVDVAVLGMEDAGRIPSGRMQGIRPSICRSDLEGLAPTIARSAHGNLGPLAQGDFAHEHAHDPPYALFAVA